MGSLSSYSRLLGFVAALLDPHRHFVSVVAKVLDECLGLQEGVARDREHAVVVHLHAVGEQGPRLCRLGADSDLEETLEEAFVVDAGADPFVVLGVTDDQPGALLVERRARRRRSPA